MPNLVSLASRVSGDVEGVPKFKKVGHATQATPLLTQFCISCIVPLIASFYAPNFSTFVRSGDMEGVPKFKK